MNMSLNIAESHRNAIAQLLDLEPRPPPLEGPPAGLPSSECMLPRWKVLVYDKASQNIIGPLMKVGALRDHGVTLHLGLHNNRTAIKEAPAVYLIEPTPENIKKLEEDLIEKKYQKSYFNFSTSIPTHLLEQLAASTAKANVFRQVASIVDRYVHFISLSSSEFCLDIPNTLEVFHGVSTDQEIEDHLTRIVERLFSVVVTLGAVPIILCPCSPNSPAHIVGNRVYEKIKTVLGDRRGLAQQLFGKSFGAHHALERPALILLDRELDFNVMLHHSWTYQSLLHDLFGLKLNRVTVEVSSDNEGRDTTKKVTKTYDLDASDTLWQEYNNRGFPEVATAISNALKDYNERMKRLGHRGADGGSMGPSSSGGLTEQSEPESLASGLASSIDALPELTEKKRCLDLHTNIATAAAGEITARGLDKLYELEDMFETGSFITKVSQLEKLLQPEEKGSLEDKRRAFICFYLANMALITPAILNKLKAKMAALGGGDMTSLAFFQRLQSFRSMRQLHVVSSGQTTVNATGPEPLQAATVLRGAATLFDRSKDILQGVRNLLPLKRDLPTARVVRDLLELKLMDISTPPDRRFLYLDPKVALNGSTAESVPRVKSSFRQAIVFMTECGSYDESNAMREIAARTGNQILYGTTEFLRPTEILEKLERLGATTTESGT